MSLLRVTELCVAAGSVEELIELDYDRRRKSRQRVTTTRGRELSLSLPRGTELWNGACLRVEDGSTVAVCAICEALSRTDCESPLDLVRVAYHLGNRHVALQIGETFVAYQRDSVLDRMVEGLGFRVRHVLQAFEPEPGAYSNHQWEGPESTRVRVAAGSAP